MARTLSAPSAQAAGSRKLTPSERNMLFAQSTRQHIQTLPSRTAAPGETISFDVPKVRLLSHVRLLVSAKLKATHATSTSYTPAPFAPFSLLRNIRMEVNNGFAPYAVSGVGAYFNMLRTLNASTLERKTSGRGRVIQGLTASSGSGTQNTAQFVVELPVTLNSRDPIGLIMTQSQETTVTVSVDVGDAAQIAPAASGYTFELSDVTITPETESYSIPVVPEALPDLSIIKLLNETSGQIAAAGEHTVKMPVGTTYRNIALYVTDNNGAGVDLAGGSIRLILNQSDRPYQIHPALLAARNQDAYGAELPKGLYMLDLGFQGVANLGGSRDYLDTERLSEFWLQFDAAGAGSYRVVYEHLSRLI